MDDKKPNMQCFTKVLFYSFNAPRHNVGFHPIINWALTRHLFVSSSSTMVSWLRLENYITMNQLLIIAWQLWMETSIHPHFLLQILQISNTFQIDSPRVTDTSHPKDISSFGVLMMVVESAIKRNLPYSRCSLQLRSGDCTYTLRPYSWNHSVIYMEAFFWWFSTRLTKGNVECRSRKR